MAQTSIQQLSVPEDKYKDRLRWHLQRADEWVKIADTKATVLLTVNGAIMVAMLALKRDDIKEFMASKWYLAALSLLFATALIFSVYFSARAVLPDLRKKSTHEESIFNPAKVGKMDLQRFRDAYQNLTAADELKNIENQVHAVSTIASKKFERIQLSVLCLVAAFLLGAVLVVVNIVIQ